MREYTITAGGGGFADDLKGCTQGGGETADAFFGRSTGEAGGALDSAIAARIETYTTRYVGLILNSAVVSYLYMQICHL